MAEFMLILPGEAPFVPNPTHTLAGCRDPAEIARYLTAGLAALDEIGAGMAAAYLSMALDALRISFNPAEDASGTD